MTRPAIRFRWTSDARRRSAPGKIALFEQIARGAPLSPHPPPGPEPQHGAHGAPIVRLKDR